ncbi:hypothetical protein ACF0H5_003280 [Mactra antiquata]
MDSSSPELKVLTATQINSMDLLNGGHLGNQPAFPGQTYGAGNKQITLEQVDPSNFEDDSDDDEYGSGKGIRPGKKTKGRVKIKMEFIENKLRRYTTFSKRKTGIMKKAYELSTLTGTQVMLLVASETGHVYTFATRKLQPMITSESGKALIQTCLNSPDPPPMAPGQQQAVEQRMNPGGFEETELTYAVEDENGKSVLMDGNGGLKPVYSMTSSPSIQENSQPMNTQSISGQQSHAQLQHTYQPVSTVVQQSQPAPSNSPQPNVTKTSTHSGISVHLPPGFIIQPGSQFAIPVQTSPQQSSQVVTSQSHQSQQQQTVYRIPTPTQHQNAQVIQSDSGQRVQTNGSSASAATVNVINAATQQGVPALTPSVFMYQTPQGIVYAPATGTLQDKTLLNFSQATTALSASQNDTGQQQGQVQQQQVQQQIITIPMPVSLAGSTQMLQLATTESTQLSELTQPSTAKKRKL